MNTSINTLQAVINSTKYKFSNGPLEGIKRKIKALKQICYGFANQKFFCKQSITIRIENKWKGVSRGFLRFTPFL